jgi:hypothetical protein
MGSYIEQVWPCFSAVVYVYSNPVHRCLNSTSSAWSIITTSTSQPFTIWKLFTRSLVSFQELAEWHIACIITPAVLFSMVHLCSQFNDAVIKIYYLFIFLQTVERSARNYIGVAILTIVHGSVDLILETSILARRMLLIISLGKSLVEGITLMYPGSRGSVVMQIILLRGTKYCFQLPKHLALI